MSSTAAKLTDVSDGTLVRSVRDMYRLLGTGRVQKVKNGDVEVEFNPSAYMAPTLLAPRATSNTIPDFS